MSKELTVAAEVAEQDFERICDFFDVELDESALDAEDKADLAGIKSKIVKNICTGRLTVGDNGQPTYTLKDGTAMTFKQPTGAILLTKVKDNDANRKMFAIIVELTGGVSSPGKWTPRDTGVLMAIVNLFISELQ